MDISSYTALFHDGSLSGIKHVNNSLILIMKSAEVDCDEIEDERILSNSNRLEGKLHISEVRNIQIDGSVFLGKWIREYDKGRILDFEIFPNLVQFSIEWVDFPPKLEVNSFSNIQIEAGQIWWERNT